MNFLQVPKKLLKIVEQVPEKNSGIALETSADVGTVVANKNPRAKAAKPLDVIRFTYQSKELYFGKTH